MCEIRNSHPFNRLLTTFTRSLGAPLWHQKVTPWSMLHITCTLPHFHSAGMMCTPLWAPSSSHCHSSWPATPSSSSACGARCATRPRASGAGARLREGWRSSRPRPAPRITTIGTGWGAVVDKTPPVDTCTYIDYTSPGQPGARLADPVVTVCHGHHQRPSQRRVCRQPVAQDLPWCNRHNHDPTDDDPEDINGDHPHHDRVLLLPPFCGVLTQGLQHKQWAVSADVAAAAAADVIILVITQGRGEGDLAANPHRWWGQCRRRWGCGSCSRETWQRRRRHLQLQWRAGPPPRERRWPGGHSGDRRPGTKSERGWHLDGVIDISGRQGSSSACTLAPPPRKRSSKLYMSLQQQQISSVIEEESSRAPGGDLKKEEDKGQAGEDKEKEVLAVDLLKVSSSSSSLLPPAPPAVNLDRRTSNPVPQGAWVNKNCTWERAPSRS